VLTLGRAAPAGGGSGGIVVDEEDAMTDIGSESSAPAPAEEDADETLATLRRLRSSIDNVDAALMYLLAERFKCTKQVGELKAEHGLAPSDPAREEQQIARLRQLAEDADLDPAFAEKWFNFVVAEVIRHHTAAADGR
jgi:chorismate mutase